MSSQFPRAIIFLSRLGLAGWIVFEFLNWIGVLHVLVSFTWEGLIVTGAFVWIVLELTSLAVRRRTGEGLSAWMYALVFLGVTFDALGDIEHWYVLFAWYDQLLHAVSGGMVTGLLVFNVLWRLKQADRLRLSLPFIGLFSWSTVALVGALYEIEEYLEDVINGTPGKRLGDGPDTADDLMWNVIGSGLVVLVVSLVLWRRGRRRDTLPVKETL